jgi:hypothetical protein
MGMIDDLKNKGEDMMKDPDTKAKVEKIADEKGISVEAAKEHFMKSKNE